MHEKLREIAIRYRCVGIVKGVEFLLPPEHAIRLLEDLATEGVLVLGCDLWRYLDRKQNMIVALVGAGDVIDRFLTQDDLWRNVEVIKDFLIRGLPDDAELVSLVYKDPQVWDLFMTYGRC